LCGPKSIPAPNDIHDLLHPMSDYSYTVGQLSCFYTTLLNVHLQTCLCTEAQQNVITLTHSYQEVVPQRTSDETPEVIVRHAMIPRCVRRVCVSCAELRT
jgi:hypothetical protein